MNIQYQMNEVWCQAGNKIHDLECFYWVNKNAWNMPQSQPSCDTKLRRNLCRQPLLLRTTLSWRLTWRMHQWGSTQWLRPPKETMRWPRTCQIFIWTLSHCHLLSRTIAGKQGEGWKYWQLTIGSRLEKPVRPPPPPANAASPAQLNGHMSTTSPDPFSNVVSPAEAQNLFNNDDAFAAFNKDVSVCS